MSLTDHQELTLMRVLQDLSGQVSLARAEANKNAIGSVAASQANTRMAIATAHMEAAAAALRLWTTNRDQVDALRHQTVMRALVQTASLHRETEAEPLPLPVEGPRAKLVLRIVLIIISMASAWVAGAGVGAEHGAEHVLQLVGK